MVVISNFKKILCRWPDYIFNNVKQIQTRGACYLNCTAVICKFWMGEITAVLIWITETTRQFRREDSEA